MRNLHALAKATGPSIEKAGDLAALLTNLNENEVLFIDEIHRLNKSVEEVLYPAMEDYCLDLMIGKGPAARSVRLDLPHFTLVGATTRAGMLSAPLHLNGTQGFPVAQCIATTNDGQSLVEAQLWGAYLQPDGLGEVRALAHATFTGCYTVGESR